MPGPAALTTARSRPPPAPGHPLCAGLRGARSPAPPARPAPGRTAGFAAGPPCRNGPPAMPGTGDH
ncbi:hypothetical protein CYL17_13270 [Thermobispora bispora]|nr:hypothetical protein [Actinomycetales bacterium]QSI48716.1 hypothetical protein CYL17_13270 [Thermobispora bispora]